MLTFKPDNPQARLRMYLHRIDIPAKKKRWHKQWTHYVEDSKVGWFQPQERIVQLKHSFIAPPPDQRPAPK